ncbi:hypothetical protein FRC17_004533, partial [Serendipita sp. 399]
FRVSNLSIKTDHTRTAPRPDLVPYTPFSQGSDSFSPGVALITSIEVIKSAIPRSAVPKTTTFNSTFSATSIAPPVPFALPPASTLPPVPEPAVLPSNALSNVAPSKLAITRSRTRPPMGPRKQRNSTMSTKSREATPPITTLDPTVLATTNNNRSRANTNASSSTNSRMRSRANTTASIGNLQSSLLSLPTTPNFEVQPIKFRGLTLDVAKWTFSQEELQEVSRRAISQSADPLSIRLVPLNVLDKDVQEELEKLELQREELKANFKYQHRRRVALLGSMHALLEGPHSLHQNHHHHNHHHHQHAPGSGNSSPLSPPSLPKLLDELREVGIRTDQITEELYGVCDQIAQMHALQDNHSASALAMALRKINASYLKGTAEVTDMKAQLACLTGEREDAWAMADSLEKEVNELKLALEVERKMVMETAVSLAAAKAEVDAANAVATAATAAAAAATAAATVAAVATLSSTSTSEAAPAPDLAPVPAPAPAAVPESIAAILSTQPMLPPLSLSPSEASSEGSTTPNESTPLPVPKKQKTRPATNIAPLYLPPATMMTKTIVSSVFPEEVPMPSTSASNGVGIGGTIGTAVVTGTSRVLAARRLSSRRSKASLRSARLSTYSPHFSTMFSSITIPSTYFDFQAAIGNNNRPSTAMTTGTSTSTGTTSAGPGSSYSLSSFLPPLPTGSIKSATTMTATAMAMTPGPSTGRSGTSTTSGMISRSSLGVGMGLGVSAGLDALALAVSPALAPAPVLAPSPVPASALLKVSSGSQQDESTMVVTRGRSLARVITPRRRRAESDSVITSPPLSFSSASSSASSASTALMHAQNELLNLLGVPVPETTPQAQAQPNQQQQQRRTRSFSDADIPMFFRSSPPSPLPPPAPAPMTTSTTTPSLVDRPQVIEPKVEGTTKNDKGKDKVSTTTTAAVPPLPPLPPIPPSAAKSTTFDSRESRIMSFYGAYLSRRNTTVTLHNHSTGGTITGNNNSRSSQYQGKRRQTAMSEWGVEALYDGILDD